MDTNVWAYIRVYSCPFVVLFSFMSTVLRFEFRIATIKRNEDPFGNVEETMKVYGMTVIWFHDPSGRVMERR